MMEDRLELTDCLSAQMLSLDEIFAPTSPTTYLDIVYATAIDIQAVVLYNRDTKL